jgi:hypothetical protein
MDGMEVVPAGAMSILQYVLDHKEELGANVPLDLVGQIEKVLHSTNSWTKQERQFEQIMEDMKSWCDFVTIKSLSSSQLSMWFHLKSDPHKVFKPFRETSALPIIYKAYQSHKYSVTSQKAKSIYDTLKIAPAAQYDTIPQEIIRVSENLYWDTNNASLTNESEQTKPCFRELFDSSGQTNINVPIDQVSFDPAVVSIYTRLLARHNGLLPDPALVSPEELALSAEDFETEYDYEMAAPLFNRRNNVFEDFQTAVKPFTVWANENDNLSVDTLNDLLKVYAVPFLRTPPKWFVYYIGDTRNGKSSCIKCQRVLLGLDNTSGLAMPALFDPHNANHVLVTMLNAADEDYDFAPKDAQQGLANFKKAATHDEIDLPMFYSQDSTVMTPMFLSIFSRNSLPNFGDGDGAQAVTKRMRAVFFKNDLSKYDSNGHDFEKETFTPEYYSKLLPLVLAYARYYNNRLLELSVTCRNNSGLVEAASDPASHFFNKLCYWFDYSVKGDFVIDQAKRFFQENGIQYSAEIITAIKNKLAQCEVKRLGTPYLGGSGRPRLAVLPNKLKRERLSVLAPDAIYSVFGNATFEQWHRRENERLAKMSPEQAYDDKSPAPSIFTLLQDLEDDGLNPAVMQQHLEEKEKKIAEASIDDKGNLVSPDGEILNGLL